MEGRLGQLQKRVCEGDHARRLAGAGVASLRPVLCWFKPVLGYRITLNFLAALRGGPAGGPGRLWPATRRITISAVIRMPPFSAASVNRRADGCDLGSKLAGRGGHRHPSHRWNENSLR